MTEGIWWAQPDPEPGDNCLYLVQIKPELIPMTLREFMERTKEIHAKRSR